MCTGNQAQGHCSGPERGGHSDCTWSVDAEGVRTIDPERQIRICDRFYMIGRHRRTDLVDKGFALGRQKEMQRSRIGDGNLTRSHP